MIFICCVRSVGPSCVTSYGPHSFVSPSVINLFWTLFTLWHPTPILRPQLVQYVTGLSLYPIRCFRTWPSNPFIESLREFLSKSNSLMIPCLSLICNSLCTYPYLLFTLFSLFFHLLASLCYDSRSSQFPFNRISFPLALTIFLFNLSHNSIIDFTNL